MLLQHVCLAVLSLASIGEGQQWARGQGWGDNNRGSDSWWGKGLDWGTASQRPKQEVRQSDYYPTHSNKNKPKSGGGIRSRYYSRDYYYDDDDYSDSYGKVLKKQLVVK